MILLRESLLSIIGCEVVACSVDSHFTHAEYAKKPRDQGGLGKMDIPMISDLSK